MEIRDILKKLAPLKKRMHINMGVYRFFLCVCIGSVFAMLVSYISLWIPIPFLVNTLLRIYLVSGFIGLAVSVFSAPSRKAVINSADNFGLKERVTTAWQLRDSDMPIAQIQRHDTFKTVSSTDFKALYKIRFPTKIAIALFISIILTSVSFIVPANARDSAKKLETLKNAVSEQLEQLEKAEEKIKSDGSYKEDELELIHDELSRLTEELKKANTKDEALKALSRAENALEKLDMNKQLDKLAERLKQSDMTSSLGESIEDGNATDFKQALEQLISQMEEGEISSEELSQLLKEVSEQTDNKELAEQLKQASDGLNSENADTQISSLENLGDALSAMMESQSSGGIGQAARQISNTLHQARRSISRVDSNTAEGESSPSGEGGENEGQGQTPGHTQAPGQGQTPGGQQASGPGQSPGQGKVPGDGQNGGGGAGEGSTDEDSGYTGGEQKGGGRKPGEGHEEAYEQLYDPDYLGGDNDPSYVSGQPGEGGTSSHSDNNQIPVKKGAILPYHEMLERYSSQTSSFMEKAEIPAAMKDIVRQYFESLE